MSKPIIEINGISKKYALSHQAGRQYTALRDKLSPGYILKKLAGKLPEQNSEKEEFWALKDVSFNIHEGETVGIIGRNGAGKSTLLKVLSKIVSPSDGEIVLRGRVASLLEVGTGFHPELTGRENIYLNGAILGMRHKEIEKKFDEIVDFAGVERFLDTPVKRYSSGMYVRLAFAVAAHLEPEILIVDEVLAVGDAEFQKKCLGKMRDVSTKGRTILFVSHNMTALKSLCEKAIWLNNGTVIDNGCAEDVISNYLQNGTSMNMHQFWNNPETAPGNESVRIHCVKISRNDNKDNENIDVNTPLKMEFEFWNLKSDVVLNFSVVLYDNQDVCVFNTCSDANVCSKGKVKGTCYIPESFLNDGIYRVRLLIVKDQSVPLIDFDNIATFEVHDVEREGAWYGKWVGAVRPKFNWKFQIE